MSDTTIGIIIGSGFTVLGVILQGLITWFLNWRSHRMSLNEQYEKDHRTDILEMRQKTETAYHQFLETLGVYLMLVGSGKSGNPCPLPKEFQDGSVLKELSHVLSAIQLYGSSEIRLLAQQYVGRFCQCTESPTSTRKDIDELDMELQEISLKMKSEMSRLATSKDNEG